MAPRIVSRTSLPSVAGKVTARVGKSFGSNTRFDDAHVRIATGRVAATSRRTYTLLYHSVSPLIPTMVEWSSLQLYSFRAPDGQRPATARVRPSKRCSARLSVRTLMR